MNVITKSLDEISYRIPPQILNIIFIERERQYRDIQTNVKDQIRIKVLNPRVLVDCNLVGGREILIPLDQLPFELTDVQYSVVYRIPKSMTDGCSINSVLNVSYGSSQLNVAFGANAITQASPGMQLGAAVMDAQMRMPYINSAQVQLVAENTIMIRDSINLPNNLYLRCILDNDDTLSHIQLRSYRHFAKLVELAVKSYIYNTYLIQMDEGQLRAGMQVNSFKQIIETYADAETNYQEYLTEKWAKVAFMNDRESFNNRFMRVLMGGTR